MNLRKFSRVRAFVSSRDARLKDVKMYWFTVNRTNRLGDLDSGGGQKGSVFRIQVHFEPAFGAASVRSGHLTGVWVMPSRCHSSDDVDIFSHSLASVATDS